MCISSAANHGIAHLSEGFLHPLRIFKDLGLVLFEESRSRLYDEFVSKNFYSFMFTVPVSVPQPAQ